MDFLNDVIIPQSAADLDLLKLIVLLAYFILIPYTAYITGAAVYSVILVITGRRKDNRGYKKLAYDIIDRAVLNKNALIALAIMPFLALLFSYAQITSKIHPSPLILLGTAFFFYAIGIYQLNLYRHSFLIETLLEPGIDSKTPDLFGEDEDSRFEDYRQDNMRQNRRSAIISIVLLYISVFLLLGGAEYALLAVAGKMDLGFMSTVFSIRSIVKFFLFIDTSLTISVLGLLSLKSAPHRIAQIRAAYPHLLRNALVTALLCVAGMPVWVLVNLYWAPKESMTETLFFTSALAIVFLFAECHILYYLIKGTRLKYGNYGFYVMLAAVLLFIAGEQSSFDSSARRQVLVLASVYDKQVQERNEKAGRGVTINGQEIFDTRCAACHRFDVKLVGPAYDKVLPKYEGKVEELVGFVLNPVKVDPAFPPMPNQGLKPAEAKAVAEYIMATYKK